MYFFCKNNKVKQIFPDGAVDHSKHIYSSCKYSNMGLSCWVGKGPQNENPGVWVTIILLNLIFYFFLIVNNHYLSILGLK